MVLSYSERHTGQVAKPFKKRKKGQGKGEIELTNGSFLLFHEDVCVHFLHTYSNYLCIIYCLACTNE